MITETTKESVRDVLRSNRKFKDFVLSRQDKREKKMRFLDEIDYFTKRERMMPVWLVITSFSLLLISSILITI